MSELAKRDTEMQLPAGGLEKLLQNMVTTLRSVSTGVYSDPPAPFNFEVTDDGKNIGVSVQVLAGKTRAGPLQNQDTYHIGMRVILDNIDAWDFEKYASPATRNTDDLPESELQETSPIRALLSNTFKFIAEKVPPEGLKINTLYPCDLYDPVAQKNRTPESSECFLITRGSHVGGGGYGPETIEINCSMEFHASQIGNVIEGLEVLCGNVRRQSAMQKHQVGGFNVPSGRIGPAISGDLRTRPNDSKE